MLEAKEREVVQEGASLKSPAVSYSFTLNPKRLTSVQVWKIAGRFSFPTQIEFDFTSAGCNRKGKEEGSCQFTLPHDG